MNSTKSIEIQLLPVISKIDIKRPIAAELHTDAELRSKGYGVHSNDGGMRPKRCRVYRVHQKL